MLDRKVLTETLCFVNTVFWKLQFIWTSSCRLLYSLAFNARFLRHLWYLISSMTTRMITGYVLYHFWNWFFVRTEHIEWKGNGTVRDMVMYLLWFHKTEQNLGNWTVVNKDNTYLKWVECFVVLGVLTSISVANTEALGHSPQVCEFNLAYLG